MVDGDSSLTDFETRISQVCNPSSLGRGNYDFNFIITYPKRCVFVDKGEILSMATNAIKETLKSKESIERARKVQKKILVNEKKIQAEKDRIKNVEEDFKAKMSNLQLELNKQKNESTIRIEKTSNRIEKLKSGRNYLLPSKLAKLEKEAEEAVKNAQNSWLFRYLCIQLSLFLRRVL